MINLIQVVKFMLLFVVSLIIFLMSALFVMVVPVYVVNLSLISFFPFSVLLEIGQFYLSFNRIRFLVSLICFSVFNVIDVCSYFLSSACFGFTLLFFSYILEKKIQIIDLRLFILSNINFTTNFPLNNTLIQIFIFI